MKRWKKVVLGALGVLGAAVLGLVAYVELRWNHSYNEVVGPELHASTDPAVIARGKYLVRGPAHCSNCHVDDFDEMGRSDKGEELALRGGCGFPMGPLGVIYTRNLTPCKETGIGRYDD